MQSVAYVCVQFSTTLFRWTNDFIQLAMNWTCPCSLLYWRKVSQISWEHKKKTALSVVHFHGRNIANTYYKINPWKVKWIRSVLEYVFHKSLTRVTRVQDPLVWTSYFHGSVSKGTCLCEFAFRGLKIGEDIRLVKLLKPQHYYRDVCCVSSIILPCLLLQILRNKYMYRHFFLNRLF